MKLCVIPARGGSKRIPKKNIKNFCGKPIIAWSIETAKESKCFDKIIVSTDDGDIANLALRYGAEVPFMRPKELSDDFTATVPVISHAIKWQIKHNQKPNYVCCIYPTAPFIKTTDLQKSLKILKESNSDYVFSATNYPYPIQRSFRISKTNNIEMFYPEHYDSRSQDLEIFYHDAGQFYWAKTNAVLKNLNTFDVHSMPILVDRFRAIDIDTPEDWKFAELMGKYLIKK